MSKRHSICPVGRTSKELGVSVVYGFAGWVLFMIKWS